MKRYAPLLIGLMFCISGAQAQTVDSTASGPQVMLAAFTDAFYAFDFNQPDGPDRLNFLFNHNRHNAFAINMAMVKLSVEHQQYRGNVAFHAGTYAQDNYAAEPSVLRNIFEANVGIALDKKSKWWIDAGVFPSHLGFESAVSIENWTLTRSLVNEGSPYFLAGAKLTGQLTDWLSATAVVCNGWQRIQRVPGSTAPGVGVQLVAQPNDRLTINYSNFIGTDDPDSTRRMRYFHNTFVQWQLTKKIGVLAGFDFGWQQWEPSADEYYNWFGISLLAQYALSEQWKLALRGEYYEDPNNVIVPTAFSFYTTGLSLNLDYRPVDAVALRMEGRWFNSRNPVFAADGEPAHDNVAVTFSLAVLFAHAFQQ